ncbi:HD-GYP domain-containing protein [Sporolituus thermophilus]|uniref:HD-GYP domain-containing protein n=1 Tax=Sporolituus thermophilus TaxID=608505 RepID=UPI001FDEDD0C|nr:HD-GYP domain-containing protein [Sporolituus thermophilus]
MLANANDSMVLAKDVLDNSGRVLLTAGVTLRPETIGLLRKHQVVSIWVKDKYDSRNREITSIQNLTCAATRLKLIYNVQNAFSNHEKFSVYLTELQQVITQVVCELSAREYVLIYLNDIQIKSEYLFMHSVNVGLFAIAIGMAMGLEEEELILLGMGGLLHDYGKTRVPPQILNKNGPLSWKEFCQVKEHAAIGYNLLRLEERLDHRVKLMALQHHERCDGRGYPWGITGSEIHPLAKIVAVADVYDALTTDRVYRPRMEPYQAIAIINQGIGSQFDEVVVRAFNQVAVPYNIGNVVTLDNGLRGAVIRINTSQPARPVVWTEQGPLNLMHEPDINIVTVI